MSSKSIPNTNRVTYGMALAKRTNIEKGQGLVALEELEAGNFACETGAVVVS